MSMSRDGTEPVELDSEPDGTELIGTVIADRYQLEHILGRGGMGLVYRAAHLGLRRKVAVKILHPSLAASGDVRSRFEREAFAAGKIDHPNCINVMDSGKLPDGTRYLAMELLDGKPLADVLEHQGQVEAGRALHILAHILRGLGHIHQAGLIHRDIKPENIFLIRQGSDEDFAKILDFGIAKGMGKTDLDEGVKLTQAGMAFGTPIYMAPEQALGNPMDGRADLYAAAVIGYEMLTGQPPFYSEDKLEVMSMHTAKPVPPMRQRLVKNGRPIPSSIERLIVRGLTKKPSERYATAEVFLAAVEDALRTPDGGVTDVQFERIPRADTTGSRPLVSRDGHVTITGEQEDLRGSTIADAIDDVLGTPSPPMPTVKPPVIPTTPPPPRGGIGIGLPYTGPSGEPIFGLTPTQRLAQAGVVKSTDPNMSLARALEPDEQIGTTPVVKPRKRWPLYAGIAAAAVVLGVVIAIATTRPSGPADDDKPEGINPESPAGKALALKKQGKFDEALAILEANPNALAADGEMLMVLGHVHAARNQKLDALEAYLKALNLRFDLEADDELRTNLRTMAADRDLLVAVRAFDLWGRTSDPDGKQALLVAATHNDFDRRHAIEPVITRLKLDDKVEWWKAYALDLQQLDTCPKRKEAVAKLRAAGNPQAVPALEQAIERKGGNVYNPKTRSWERVKLNACLIDDARAAIGALNGLK